MDNPNQTPEQNNAGTPVSTGDQTNPGTPVQPGSEPKTGELVVVATEPQVSEQPPVDPEQAARDAEAKELLEKAGKEAAEAGKKLSRKIPLIIIGVVTVAALGGIGIGMAVSALIGAIGASATVSTVIGSIFGFFAFLGLGVGLAIWAFVAGIFGVVGAGLKVVIDKVAEEEAKKKAAEPVVIDVTPTVTTESGAAPADAPATGSDADDKK